MRLSETLLSKKPLATLALSAFMLTLPFAALARDNRSRYEDESVDAGGLVVVEGVKAAAAGGLGYVALNQDPQIKKAKREVEKAKREVSRAEEALEEAKAMVTSEDKASRVARAEAELRAAQQGAAAHEHDLVQIAKTVGKGAVIAKDIAEGYKEDNLAGGLLKANFDNNMVDALTPQTPYERYMQQASEAEERLAHASNLVTGSREEIAAAIAAAQKARVEPASKLEKLESALEDTKETYGAKGLAKAGKIAAGAGTVVLIGDGIAELVEAANGRNDYLPTGSVITRIVAPKHEQRSERSYDRDTGTRMEFDSRY